MTWILRARCEARGCNCSTAVDEATCTIRTTCLSCRWSRKAAFATGRIASRRRGSPIPSPCELTIRLLRCAVREPSWRTTTGYPPSSPARTRYACRHRKLPHVTHRVLRPVHEAADDGRRELRPPHPPKIARERRENSSPPSRQFPSCIAPLGGGGVCGNAVRQRVQITIAPHPAYPP